MNDYPVVTCSQCGKAFAGPRPSGFSHCHNHKGLRCLTHREEMELQNVTGNMSEEKHIDIVFDGPPGHDAGRFVEVENERRESIRFGEWLHRDDGYWVLRIAKATGQ